MRALNILCSNKEKRKEIAENSFKYVSGLSSVKFVKDMIKYIQGNNIWYIQLIKYLRLAKIKWNMCMTNIKFFLIRKKFLISVLTKVFWQTVFQRQASIILLALVKIFFWSIILKIFPIRLRIRNTIPFYALMFWNILKIFMLLLMNVCALQASMSLYRFLIRIRISGTFWKMENIKMDSMIWSFMGYRKIGLKTGTDGFLVRRRPIPSSSTGPGWLDFVLGSLIAWPISRVS